MKFLNACQSGLTCSLVFLKSSSNFTFSPIDKVEAIEESWGTDKIHPPRGIGLSPWLTRSIILADYKA